MREIPQYPYKAIVAKYVEKLADQVRKGIGLILWGPYGSGKSAIGCILLKALFVKTGQIGLWVRATDIPSFVIEKTSFDSVETYKDRMASVPLLVIDELIVRGNDRFRETVVEDLIRERTNEGLATIITTNLPPSELRKRYPALAAVLQECSLPIKVHGCDFRKSKRVSLEREFKT